MATCTGDYAYDFTGQSNEAPWVETGYSDLTNTMRIVSGLLQPAAGVEARLAFTGSGTAYSYTGGAVTAKAEINESAGGGDWIQFGCLDQNGDGYLLEMNGTSGYISYYDNNTFSAVVGTATVTFATNDNWNVTVTKGSPNSIAVTRNGGAVTFTTSTHTATLADMRAVWGATDGNVAGCKYKSIAVDGMTGGGGGSKLLLQLAQY